jgi:hypothetical protein
MDESGRTRATAAALLVIASVALLPLFSPTAAALGRQRVQPPPTGADTVSLLGITLDGHIGRFGPGRQWHPASALEIAGIGPTEGTHLPLLGSDPAPLGVANDLG